MFKFMLTYISQCERSKKYQKQSEVGMDTLSHQ